MTFPAPLDPERRKDRIRAEFRRSTQSTTPTWAYALLLAGMLTVVVALAVYAGTR